ncbi:SDR family oxidoreductase [Streptomyces lunaelactis]|uniref:SDR family oxidoreductase n=1 Tax=Streptomyces lunaelactis TaxID=1535768 RepID=UPI0015851513|nr:SDR family oxidoreductase [Streptomyces lunaelactis]NUK53644.1 SDR family oxidoreductase [Streptomyces lunaelactis]NUK62893.1 SDR family oxidoreductase [Streptomyces lunaelactis]
MIIVTGANGQLGRAIVEDLLGRVPAGQIAVSVRDAAKAQVLQERGVRVRRGDFDDPASLAHAFEGASQVLIVSAATTGEAAIAQHRTAIEAAQKAGAHRILYTSHQGANPSSPFAPMPDHAATEAILRDCGVPFTSLRNGFYASTTVRLLGAALKTGELAAPQDGPVSWTAHTDLAEAAAITLAEDGRFDGPTPPLTASQALDLADIAEIASDLIGRPVKRVIVTDEDYRAGLVSHGVPETQAEMLLGLFAASRQGEFSQVDPTLADLIGRPSTPVQDVLKAALTTNG